MDAKETAIAAKVATAEGRLTQLLAELSKTTDVEKARELAREFLLNCAMDKHTPAKLRQLEGMTSLYKITSLCYNTMLSGEGLKVCK